MAAPNLIEIANMKTWSIHTHYFNNRQMYVTQGRAIVTNLRTMLKNAQAAARAQSGITNITENEIATAFITFLTKDKNWMAYLDKKAHMTKLVHAAMTETMARFIASEAYEDIIR
jgi:hypothetical protein